MKHTKLLLIMGIVLCGLALLGVAYGKGLSVSPSSYRWDNVEIGKVAECPACIMVKNDSDSVRSYTLRAVKPEDIDIKLKEGFKLVPSTNWVSFERKRITVGPGEWKQVKLFIEIPEKRENYNKKWEFYLEIKEYPARGQMFALACYSRFFLLTENARGKSYK